MDKLRDLMEILVGSFLIYVYSVNAGYHNGLVLIFALLLIGCGFIKLFI